MSVVMDDTATDEAPQPWYLEHPFIALGIAAAVALVLLKWFTTSQQQSQPPTTAQANNPTGGQGVASTDTSGNPIYYVPTQDTFLNYNYASNSFDNGQFAGNTGNVSAPVDSPVTTTSTSNTTTNNPPPVVVQTPPSPSGPPPPQKGQTPPPKVQTPPPTTKGSWTCRYTVQEGDMLSTIAAKYHTNWPAIYGHNTNEIDIVAEAMHYIIPGGPWNNIRPGEVLFVPCQ